MDRKVKCTRRCGWRGVSADLLTAQSPFEPDGVVTACPYCKAIGEVVYVCDEPGCWREVACGTPTETGYRNTCGEHWPKKEPEGN